MGWDRWGREILKNDKLSSSIKDQWDRSTWKVSRNLTLQVVYNEKQGGSGKWRLLSNGLMPRWWTFFFLFWTYIYYLKIALSVSAQYWLINRWLIGNVHQTGISHLEWAFPNGARKGPPIIGNAARTPEKSAKYKKIPFVNSIHPLNCLCVNRKCGLTE